MKQIVILLMVVMCATMFTACSDDDNDVTRGANGERLVSSYTYTELEDNWTWSYTNRYKYDKQGRTTELESTEIDKNETDIYCSFYTYEENKIMIDNDGDKMICTLNSKGLITKSSDPEYGESEYLYNDLNQLIEITGSIQATFTWKNGNIIKESTKAWHSEFKYEYQYNSDENKTPIIKLFGSNTAIDNALYAAGYFGMRTKNLCVKRIGNNKYDGIIHTYTLDKEGYVTKANGTAEEQQENIIIEYK